MNTLQRRSPLLWVPSTRHYVPDSDTGRARSRYHSYTSSFAIAQNESLVTRWWIPGAETASSSPA